MSSISGPSGYSTVTKRVTEHSYDGQIAFGLQVWASKPLLSTSVSVRHVPAELYSGSFAVRLQHLCDAVLQLEAVSDASSVVRLAPDPTRHAS